MRLLLGLLPLAAYAAAQALPEALPKLFAGRPDKEHGFLLPPENKEELDVLARAYAGVQTGWYNQTLDHFDPMNGGIFQQRYFLNAQYFKPGGPLFLQIGGEGAISPYFSAYGDWVENGRRQNALMFQLEHRFYGQTRPMPDLSVASLKYLNSEQALADIAQFITAMKAKWNIPNAKVIVFGGSYAGAMASWFRLKYPMVADGAVGSSGPVWAKADFFEYLEVVGKASESISPGCYNNIKAGFGQVSTMVQSNQLSQVNSMFKTCTPLNANDPKNIQSFFGGLYGLFQGQVQYNGQGPYGVLPLCLMMANTTAGSPAQRLAAIATAPQQLSSNKGTKCWAYDYHGDIEYISNSTLAAGASGTRQWIWQTCTEFGYYQTTDSNKQPFGKHVPLSFYEDVYCNACFGTSYASIKKGIAASLNIFGGTNLKATNVVLPNGSYDPWHRLGVLASPNPSSPAVFIPGGSHCQDMGPPRPTDSAAMRAARKRIAAAVAFMCHNPQP